MDTQKIVVAKVSLCEQLITNEDVGVIKKQDGEMIVIYFVGLNKTIKLHQSEIDFLDVKNYGDLFDKKICNVCHKIRPTVEFDLNQNGKGDRPVRRPSCKACRREIDGMSISTTDRKEWNKVKPEWVEFECPICRKTTIPPVTSKVVLNHDHKTGVPSGWICDSCNTGLGRFKDSIPILQNAIKYLESMIKQD